MDEGLATAVEIDWELLRSGIRLMALSALGDLDAAEEVAQESLARVIGSGKATDRTIDIASYVAGIARHVIADHFRARERDSSGEQLDPASLPAEDRDPLSTLCSHEELAALRRALGSLSAEDRKLVRLCYVDGMTPGEIAETMEMPPERIRQRKLRAILRLRAAFNEISKLRHVRSPAPIVTEEAAPLEVLRNAT